ncbi:hypothetical protein QAD02_022017 [Eretmocerus hayati]|uniref:Uncharacterized protein n=1 Tax=Eretmocerus hayati TaxID=131215 RepID=A0ACC2PSY7_9HYME|nr:hypothetical protein QAD02_022017 [Eretmocerus hayati]
MEDTGMLSGKPANQKGKKLWQYISATSGSLLAMGVGTTLSWSAPVLPVLESTGSWLPLDKEQASWVGSLLAVGAICGALPAGLLGAHLGRRRALLLVGLPLLASWGLMLVARQPLHLYIARLVAGLGVGGTCVLLPGYLSEIAEAESRGAVCSLFQLLFAAGLVWSASLGAFLDFHRLAYGCALVELLFFASFAALAPESPVWLVSKGRKLEATVALRRLRGEFYDVDRELAQTQKESEEISSKKNLIFDLVRFKAPRKALLICLAVMMFQQLSGINAIVFYTVGIFKDAHSSVEPNTATILVSLVQFAMSFVATGFVDKAGRRPLLMLSCMAMSCSMITLGLYFKLKESGSNVSQIGWLPLSSLIAFMIAFSIGAGPVPWMLMGELFTVELKGSASSLAVMLNWFFAFLVTNTYSEMERLVKASGTFWIFAVLMALATIFVYRVVPETKGKSINEVQIELLGHQTLKSSRS